MKIQCKNCLPAEGIEIPDFSQSDKNKLLELMNQSPLHAVKYLINYLKISHVNAKYVVTHINPVHGYCNRCKFAGLNEEYIECAKCGSLNMNWKVDNT